MKKKSSVVVQKSSWLCWANPQSVKILYLIRVNNQGAMWLDSFKAPILEWEMTWPFLLNPYRTNGPYQSCPEPQFTSRRTGEFFIWNNRSYVNIYKVTPTQNAILYAEALATSFGDIKAEVPPLRWMSLCFGSLQFQASTLMDLKYFLVCRFVLNNFDKAEGWQLDGWKTWTIHWVCSRHYEGESGSTDFMFLVPLLNSTIADLLGKISVSKRALSMYHS